MNFSIRHEIADSALHLRAIEDPDSAALASFDCGDTLPAESINEYVRSGRWFGLRAHVAVEFLTADGDTVGIAVVRRRTQPHPTVDSGVTAPYLVLLAMGVNRPYRGQVDPGAPDARRFSDTIVRGVFRLAVTNATAGVFLRIREGNEPAMRLYKRNRFETDPGIAHVDEDGVRFRGMRRIDVAEDAVRVRPWMG